jgi:hypothetical protein
MARIDSSFALPWLNFVGQKEKVLEVTIPFYDPTQFLIVLGACWAFGFLARAV